MTKTNLPLSSLSKLKDHQEAVVVDSETTGLNFLTSTDYDAYGPDRICSLSAILIKRTAEGGWMPVSQRTSRFSPGRPINPGAARVNRFFWSDGKEPAPPGMDDLRGLPKFADSAPSILNYFGGRLIIAHNAPFDLEAIDEELKRADLPLLEGNYACTRQAFSEKIGLGRNHPRAYGTRMDDVCAAYGIPRGARAKGHGAAVDAGLCAEGFAYLDYEGLMLSCPILDLPHRTAPPALRP